jgi:hypothetical protein
MIEAAGQEQRPSLINLQEALASFLTHTHRLPHSGLLCFGIIRAGETS